MQIIKHPNKILRQPTEEVNFPLSEQNKIIIFPSCLEHMVKKHSNSTTISGNILIEKLSK